jgi:hypothetical protein
MIGWYIRPATFPLVALRVVVRASGFRPATLSLVALSVVVRASGTFHWSSWRNPPIPRPQATVLGAAAGNESGFIAYFPTQLLEATNDKNNRVHPLSNHWILPSIR